MKRRIARTLPLTRRPKVDLLFACRISTLLSPVWSCMVRSVARPRTKKAKKVSRKPKRVAVLQFSSGQVEGKWDKKKTVRQNIAALGVAPTLNTESDLHMSLSDKGKMAAEIGGAWGSRRASAGGG